MMNTAVKTINEYVCKLTKKKLDMFYLNNDDDLLDKDITVRFLYDARDATGVHLSNKAAEVLEENIQTFFNSDITTDLVLNETPFSKKRNCSVLSNTPHLTGMFQNKPGLNQVQLFI